MNTATRVARGDQRGFSDMGRRMFGIATFIISMVVAVTVVVVHFFGADIAALKAPATQFYAMLSAYVILLLGSISRAL